MVYSDSTMCIYSDMYSTVRDCTEIVHVEICIAGRVARSKSLAERADGRVERFADPLRPLGAGMVMPVIPIPTGPTGRADAGFPR